MKKTLFIGFAASAFLAGAAGAQQLPKSTSPSTEKAGAAASDMMKSGNQAATQATEAAKSATEDTTKAVKGTELSGELKSVDKEKRSLTISPATGGEQDVKVATSAIITRDGAAASLDQLKEGDQVRASFGPSTHEATMIEVHSKK